MACGFKGSKTNDECCCGCVWLLLRIHWRMLDIDNTGQCTPRIRSLLPVRSARGGGSLIAPCRSDPTKCCCTSTAPAQVPTRRPYAGALRRRRRRGRGEVPEPAEESVPSEAPPLSVLGPPVPSALVRPWLRWEDRGSYRTSSGTGRAERRGTRRPQLGIVAESAGPARCRWRGLGRRQPGVRRRDSHRRRAGVGRPSRKGRCRKFLILVQVLWRVAPASDGGAISRIGSTESSARRPSSPLADPNVDPVLGPAFDGQPGVDRPRVGIPVLQHVRPQHRHAGLGPDREKGIRLTRRRAWP
jgi:hypothetical protein